MTLQRADDDIEAAAPTADFLPRQDTDQPPPKTPRRLTRRARLILIGALVLLLAGGGVGVWALFFRSTTPTTTFRTVTVAQETLKQSVSGTGTLNPATQANLSFASSGTVTSVDVEPGDLVTKGETLAAIDDSELEIDYESAKASQTEAQDSLSTLEDDESATATAIAAAQATVKVKENAVTQAKTALDESTMVSPIAGKVAAVTVAKGDTVSGGSSTSGSSGSSVTGSSGTGKGTGTAASSSSTAAITVISNGTFTVTTSVSNADVISIKKGLQATITPTSSNEAVFGIVSTVGVVASLSSTSASSSTTGSATFPVTIKVTGTHKDLLPGSSATVAITVKQLTDVISLPTQAVTTVDNKTVVQKLVNGKQVPTEVTLGASVGASTVITKGLAVGDQVVLASFRITGGTGTGQGTRNGGTGTQGGAGGGFPGGGLPGQQQGRGTQVGTR